MKARATLAGMGLHVPARLVTNGEIAGRVNTTDAWIQERTGIRQRYFAHGEETTADLATRAAAAALIDASVPAGAVDLTIVATATAEYAFPSVACRVQGGLGLAGGLDISAACSGFVYGLAYAAALIQAEMAETILVIGSEIFSRVLDWHDRATCVLFGDGAGAVVVRRSDQPGVAATFVLGADGRMGDVLTLPSGSGLRTGVDRSPSTLLRMHGSEVYRFGVRTIVEGTRAVLERSGLGLADVRWLAPHQANERMLAAGAERLGLPLDRVMSTVGEYANTAAASIPMALATYAGRDFLASGDRLVLIGFGGGLSWGAGVIGWRD
ncbi:MAG TPA: beta-ketoacyl-ACP synthase 3 [Chloroflexota bacterium]|nr:beta-ketoacyl-ACP synthase 3 [Chloroflexota bacterium]